MKFIMVRSHMVHRHTLDNNLLSHAKSEYSILVVLQLMEDIGKVNNNLQVEVDLMKKVIQEADNIFDFAETMNREDEERYNVDEELQKVVDKYRKEVLDRAAVLPYMGTPTPKTPEHDKTSSRSN